MSVGGEDAVASGGRSLAASALYKEDLLEAGHTQVWGSFYDAAEGRWGYACCRGTSRGSTCAVAGDVPRSGRGTGEGAVVFSATVGMDDLRQRDSFSDAVDFVAHWVRAVLYDWRKGLEAADPRLTAHARFGSMEQLTEAERAVAPLLRLLESCSINYHPGETVQVWSVGHNKWMRDGRVLEVLDAETALKASASRGEGAESSKLVAGSVLVSFNGGESKKWVSPLQLDSVLKKGPHVELGKEAVEKLERIALLSTERDYHAANQAYIELTVGHGRWHEDLSIKGLTGCNKAPRNGFKVKRDQANFLDTEEAKEYMFCLKRMVTLLQLLRPNADVSKHFT